MKVEDELEAIVKDKRKKVSILKVKTTTAD